MHACIDTVHTHVAYMIDMCSVNYEWMKSTVRISTKYMINNVTLNRKYVLYPYFLTVVSKNIIFNSFLEGFLFLGKVYKVYIKNVDVYSLSCDSLKSLIFPGNK